MAVECYINQIRYPLVDTVELCDHAAATSESSIRVDIRGLPEPQALDVVYLFRDGRILFGGLCGIPSSPAWTSEYTLQHYDLTVSGMNNLLTHRYVNKAWRNSNLYDIVMEIYESILAQDNIALGEVSKALTNLPRQVYIAPDMTAYDVLNELAGLVGAVWDIKANPDWTVSDYLSGSQAKPFRFSFCLKDDFPVVMADKGNICSLQKNVESYALRTVQVVNGATGVTDTQRETTVYRAEDGIITTTWPVYDMPVIYYGTPEVQGTVGVSGIDDDDDTKQFLFSYNSTEIKVNDSAVNPIPDGTTVQIRYRGLFQLRVRVRNDQMIEDIAVRSGVSGILEEIETDDRITDAASLIEHATTALYHNSQPETTLEIATRSMEGTEPFTIWRCQFPECRINDDYVVVERTVTITGGSLEVQLKCKDRGFLTAYGKTFYKQYKDAAAGIREDEVVIASDTISTAVTAAAKFAAKALLVCYVDDGQPWLWGGDHYAQY